MGVTIVRCIKQIIVWLYNRQQDFVLKVKIWKIQLDPNIVMNKSVRIRHSTILDTRYGGKISIGKNTELLEDVKILTYGGNIEIGEFCSINPGTIIYGHGNTQIGNNVLIAGGCMIIPANHIFTDISKNINSQGIEVKPIVIEDNVWIAHGCSILAGVNIKKGSVVAAGSVVNKSYPENSIIGGVPAKIIKSIK
ncbi:MAG: hypothetical protein CVU09_15240 [Bacteroidetes bacterium HGW-Bacteroidetes-4]|jgi:acetyltransferase-like isoleucine patch superfamily enzyme|nr:MAG: hypothetical protein CVU09_15240 [Bacteroidetes bacterium HGW-Bacteroidetes-4]